MNLKEWPWKSKSIPLLLCFTLIVILGFCLVQISSRKEIFIEPSTIKLGGVPQSTVQRAIFTIVNNSSKETNIYLERKNCSCIDVELEKSHLARGESGKLTLLIGIGDSVGVFNSEAVIVAESSSRLQFITASVQYRAERAAILNPTRLDLGTITQDQLIKAIVTVQNGESNLKWHKIVADSKCFGKLNVRQVGESWLVDYAVDPRLADLGRFKDTITLRLLSSDNRLIHSSYVPVDALINSSITYFPKSIFFTTGKPGAEIGGILKIGTTNGNPISLRSVESDLKIEYQYSSVSPDFFSIEYSLTLPNKEQAVNGNLVIYMDVGGMRRINIPIIGYVKP